MRRTPKRRSARLGALILVGLAAVAIFVLQPGFSRGEKTQAVIGASSSNGFRVVLTASKADRSQAAAATVRIAAFERSRGSWHQLGRRLEVGMPKGWFWNVVTGPHAVREFSLSTDGAEPVTVRLLVSPSLGWSKLYAFHVQAGALV